MRAKNLPNGSIEQNIDQSAGMFPTPIPTEIPQPPDLSHLPLKILHSGTIETLIGQNEDLMARLKVNVRRNGILESQLLEQERAHDELLRANQSLAQQLQTLQEKNLVWREKSAKIDDHSSALKDENSQMKALLATLEKASREKSAELQRLNRYRTRIGQRVRPMIDDLKEELANQSAARASRDAQIADLRTRMSQMIVHTQGLERKAARDQAQLVEQYEAAVKTLEADLNKTTLEAKSLKEKAGRLDQVLSQVAECENKIIYLQRSSEENSVRLKTELRAAQEQIVRYRTEANALKFQARDQEKQSESAIAEYNTLKKEHQAAQEQLESLRLLWSDTQKQMTQVRGQVEALNRLNQELSHQLLERNRTEISGPTSSDTEMNTAGMSSETLKSPEGNA